MCILTLRQSDHIYVIETKTTLIVCATKSNTNFLKNKLRYSAAIATVVNSCAENLRDQNG